MGRILTILVFLLILPSICLADTGDKTYTAVTGPDGVQRAEVTGGGYFFKPERITVKVNTPVELILKKDPSGILPHDFIIKAPDAGMDITVSLSKAVQTVRFTPTKTGSYAFYCGRRFLFFKSHRARGMEGTLEVVE